MLLGDIHIEVRRGRCTIASSTARTTIPSSSTTPKVLIPTIIITIIDLQLPSHNLIAVQIAHRGGRLVDVRVLQKAEAFRFAGVFVVDEAEVEDCADAAEDFGY